MKTGIPWRVFIMADARSVNRRAAWGFRRLPRRSGPPSTAHPPLAQLFHHSPAALLQVLALEALRAMGAAMSLSPVAEPGR
jgi:hypothetical protein